MTAVAGAARPAAPDARLRLIIILCVILILILIIIIICRQALRGLLHLTHGFDDPVHGLRLPEYRCVRACACVRMRACAHACAHACVRARAWCVCVCGPSGAGFGGPGRAEPGRTGRVGPVRLGVRGPADRGSGRPHAGSAWAVWTVPGRAGPGRAGFGGRGRARAAGDPGGRRFHYW